MAVKHTLAAGVAALALLVTPVGLTVQWSEHGPAMATGPAISTVHAASNRPTSTTAPSDGAPTLISSGTATKTTGWQVAGGKFSDKQCQAVADAYDDMLNDAAVATANGSDTRAFNLQMQAENLLDKGMDQGCAFTGPIIPD